MRSYGPLLSRQYVRSFVRFHNHQNNASEQEKVWKEIRKGVQKFIYTEHAELKSLNITFKILSAIEFCLCNET